MNGVYVLKRHRQHSEPFDPVKLHQSVMAACLSVRSLEGEAHLTAEQVCSKVIDWLATKTEVTSADIRRVAAKNLHIYHPEAAYLYEHHRTII
ncbi:MAG TPA: ATP cone domain-containing protein [Verrucomicrobiae bacterium]|nr:ATP cone domain-containing protein [Verrucomicrobiae bacterium]